MFFPLLGFAPDADPTQQGVMTDCDLIIPTLRGFKAIPSDADAGLATAPSAIASAFSYKLGDGTNQVLAGTEGSASAATSRLYNVTPSGWTDLTSSASGGDYTATARARWTFTTYGDTVYAAQKGVAIQKSTGSEFTAVSGAPKALCILSVLDFVMAFNTDDGGAVYGNDANRWWCSAAGDPDSWTADIATQATTGLLTDTPGGITAAARVGSNVVAFKERNAYLGTYQGAPAVWGWQLIPGSGLGAYSPYSVVTVEGIGVLTIGTDNIYVYDGSRATPIGTNRVSQFLFSDLDYANAQSIVGYHNQADSLVYWYYPSRQEPTGELTRYLAYNYRSDRWGFGRKSTKFAFAYLSPGATYDSLADITTTYDALPTASYDDWLAPTGTYLPANVGSDGMVTILDGESGTSYYTTGNLGLDGAVTVLSRSRPRFITAPTTGEQQHSYTNQLGSTETISQASSGMSNGTFDHVFSARWHKLKHTYTGNMELTGIDVEANADSYE